MTFQLTDFLYSIHNTYMYRPINNIKLLRLYLSEDFKASQSSWFINPIRWLIGEDGARLQGYIYILRILEYFYNKYKSDSSIKYLYLPLYIMFSIIHRRQSYKYNVHIDPNTCDYGLFIVHMGCIHVNATHVGKYCTLTQGVVLGQKNGIGNRPVIGDNVNLTLGCKVIGKVHVGDNVIVCPNSVVIKDLPSNVIASGVPVSIIKQKK